MKPRVARSPGTALACAILFVVSCGGEGDGDALPLEEALGTDTQGVHADALDALLADTSDGPVDVVHLVTLKEGAAQAYAEFETEANAIRSRTGGRVVASVEVEGTVLGTDTIDLVRVVQYPNASAYAALIQSARYRTAAEQERAAVKTKTLLYGSVFPVPFDEPTGAFQVAEFEGLTPEDAAALLSDRLGDTENPEGDADVFIDMLVDDNEEPFFMVNLLEYRELAQYSEAHLDADPSLAGISGLEADAKYSAVVLPELLERNSGPQRVVSVKGVLVGERSTWETCAIAKYASVDALLDMIFDPTFQAGAFHKFASLEATSVYYTRGEVEHP